MINNLTELFQRKTSSWQHTHTHIFAAHFQFNKKKKCLKKNNAYPCVYDNKPNIKCTIYTPITRDKHQLCGTNSFRVLWCLSFLFFFSLFAAFLKFHMCIVCFTHFYNRFWIANHPLYYWDYFLNAGRTKNNRLNDIAQVLTYYSHERSSTHENRKRIFFWCK